MGFNSGFKGLIKNHVFIFSLTIARDLCHVTTVNRFILGDIKNEKHKFEYCNVKSREIITNIINMSTCKKNSTGYEQI